MYNKYEHEKYILKTEENIVNWLESQGITSFNLLPAEDETFPYLIATNCDLYIKNKEMPYLPVGFLSVFGSVVLENCGLKSLKGFPQRVLGQQIILNDNELTSLEFCAQEFRGSEFACANNHLTDLAHIPTMFQGNLRFYNNLITEFNLPQETYESIVANQNKIENLSTAPLTINKRFFLHNNPIKTIADMRTCEGGDFIFTNDLSIEGLEYLTLYKDYRLGNYEELKYIKEKMRLKTEVCAPEISVSLAASKRHKI